MRTSHVDLEITSLWLSLKAPSKWLPLLQASVRHRSSQRGELLAGPVVLLQPQKRTGPGMAFQRLQGS
jgi:hypothetical protein